MVDTRSNMQLADLDSKPYSGKSLQNIIDRAIGARFYPPPGSLLYQLICLGKCHGRTHTNFGKNKKSDIKKTIIFSAHNHTIKARTDQI